MEQRCPRCKQWYDPDIDCAHACVTPEDLARMFDTDTFRAYQKLTGKDSAQPTGSTGDMRKQFEAWISAPPFERDPVRYGGNTAWPGSYIDLDIDLAWQAWEAAKSR